MENRLERGRSGGRAGARRRVVLLLVGLVAFGCKKSPTDDKGNLEKPVATVARDTVKVGDVVTYMRAANLDRTLSARDSAIEDLIAVRVVKTAAKGLKLTPEEETQKKDWESQLKLSQFRDSVIAKGVVVPDSLIQAYYKERVGDEVKARHILVALLPTATADEKAAARAKAEEALKKARTGEDFAKLSREYSEPKTAATGGDLGWFGKGDMVPAFERAAFALKPGEISEVVETRFGYHVIKVEDKRKKTLEEMRAQIVKALEGPLKSQAEERYIENMMSESALQFYEANVDTLVKVFAQDSVGELPPTRAALPIATWDKGKLTIGDIAELYRALPPENQAAVKALDRDRMINALTPLVRNRMLLARAEAADIKLDPERQKMLDDRLESVVVTDMLRGQVKEDAVVSDSAVRAAWEADSSKYPGKTFAEAQGDVRKELIQEKMRYVNSQAGQRELVHEVASGLEGKTEIQRFPKNYELVLAALAPIDSAAQAEKAKAGAGTPGTPAGAAPGGAGTPAPGSAGTGVPPAPGGATAPGGPEGAEAGRSAPPAPGSTSPSTAPSTAPPPATPSDSR